MFDASTVITSYLVKHLKEFGWEETRQDFRVLANAIDKYLMETMEFFSQKASVKKSSTLSARCMVQSFYFKEDRKLSSGARELVKQYQTLLDAFAQADAIDYLEFLPQFTIVVVADYVPVWYGLEEVSPMVVQETLYFTDVPGEEPQKVMTIEEQTIRRNFW